MHAKIRMSNFLSFHFKVNRNILNLLFGYAHKPGNLIIQARTKFFFRISKIPHLNLLANTQQHKAAINYNI